MTRRKEIIEILKHRKLTLKELADEFLTEQEEILEDLRHIAQTVFPEMDLRMEVPVCKNCGYAFKKRKKGKPPSRCPQCKGEAIIQPQYFIVERDQHRKEKY